MNAKRAPILIRLVDVELGHEHDRLAHPLLETQKLVLQPASVDRVDRAEGLVHQHQRRIGRERAGHAHTLLLPARQLARVAGTDLIWVETDEDQQFVYAIRDPMAPPAEQLRNGRDVLIDRLVREQANLLDHVADLAPQLRGRRGRG